MRLTILTPETMQIFFVVILFIFGLLFGSFSSVIIERIKFKKAGIMTGRSECPSCKHLLSSLDLFPLFSWLFLRGKCRYCQTKISPIYPLLELTMALLFALGGYFFVDIAALLMGSLTEIARLGFILVTSFVVTVFTFYDIRFLEIPDEILIPAIFIILALLGVNSFYALPIFSHFQTFEGVDFLNIDIINALAGALFIYSFFYLQILIPGLTYTIQNKKYKLASEVVIGYVGFFWWMFRYLFTGKIEEEEHTDESDMIPTWIGGGDLRIALFMGLILGLKLSLMALFASYIVGSIVGVAILLRNREQGQGESQSERGSIVGGQGESQSERGSPGGQIIPFGPFLGAGLMITLFWHTEILKLFEKFVTHSF